MKKTVLMLCAGAVTSPPMGTDSFALPGLSNVSEQRATGSEQDTCGFCAGTSEQGRGRVAHVQSFE
jgi:hypothetical protein